jgi:GNAT superfamily N-acetyltransferase
MAEQRAHPSYAPEREIERRAFALRDGRSVVVRSARPNDAPQLMRLCERVSTESSRFRFFRAGRRLTAAEALDVVSADPLRNETILALNADDVVAWASFNQLGSDPHAEMTLLVDDAYQGSGLGREMLERLISAARRRHYWMLLAELMPDNERMLQLLETAGLPYFADEYFGVIRVHLFLQRPYL